MLIEAQQYGLRPKDIELISQELKKGRVGIVPTDSIYAFVCRSDQKAGFEAICALKNMDPKDALLSIVCRDLSQASEYFVQWPTPVFRILNNNLPGPFTFILQSGHRAPAFLKNKRKTLGLRIPNHKVMKAIMDHTDIPLIVSSVLNDDDNIESYYSDSDELTLKFERQVGFIVTDESGVQEASTVIDLTEDEPVIIRQSLHEAKI